VRSFRLVAALLAIVLGCDHPLEPDGPAGSAPGAREGKADSPPGADDAAARIDQIMGPHYGPGEPGAAVLVVAGERAFRRTYGLSDVARGEPVRPETLFRLSSNSKAFTALGIMMLRSRGLLAAEATLGDVRGSDGSPLVTSATLAARHVRALLGHVSGIPEYACAGDAFTDYDALAQADGSVPARFRPEGDAYAYTNANYAILGVAIERLSGRWYEDFITHEIFRPLGMNASLVHNPAYPRFARFPDGSSRAYGHVRRGGRFELLDQECSTSVVADGNLYSSVVDLEPWVRLWFEGAAAPVFADAGVGRALMAEAITAGTAGGQSTGYGYGWRPMRYRGEPLIAHGGTTGGFKSYVEIYPARKLAVVILTNRYDQDDDARNDLSGRLVDSLVDAFWDR
jgi:CubicO group peptidase (beta-lactamase class C family)